MVMTNLLTRNGDFFVLANAAARIQLEDMVWLMIQSVPRQGGLLGRID